LAAWGSNPDHHSALAILALNYAAHANRAHKGDKRYVRRKGGKFTKSQDDVGRSLAADRSLSWTCNHSRLRMREMTDIATASCRRRGLPPALMLQPLH
jgi:hypothetical protein